MIQLAEGTDADTVIASVPSRLRRDMSPRHVPDEIFVIDEVPYNLTGKKLEVPVKKILLGAPAGTMVSASSMRDRRIFDVFEQDASTLAAS